MAHPETHETEPQVDWAGALEDAHELMKLCERFHNHTIDGEFDFRPEEPDCRDARALLKAVELLGEWGHRATDGDDSDQCPVCLWMPGREWDPSHGGCLLVDTFEVVQAASESWRRFTQEKGEQG